MIPKRYPWRKCVLLLLPVLACAGLAFADDYVKYSDTNYLLRTTVTATGNIYEYKNEDKFVAPDGTHYGRTILEYSGGVYKTWEWNDATDQVRYTEYSGTYSPTNNVPWEDRKSVV